MKYNIKLLLLLLSLFILLLIKVMQFILFELNFHNLYNLSFEKKSSKQIPRNFSDLNFNREVIKQI